MDILDDSYVLPAATNFSYECSLDSSAIEVIKPIVSKKDTILHEIVGYSGIKTEFLEALDSSSPVSMLLVGPPANPA